MLKVLRTGGGDAGTLAWCLHIALLLHLPQLVLAPTKELNKEENTSLWHVLADALIVVHETDRDRFLELCLREQIVCDNQRFTGPVPTFRWRFGNVSDAEKERFWHTYACAYNRDLSQCPVDGSWSTWSPWSGCSGSCDVLGKQSRQRTCSNPVPVRGGRRCDGSVRRSRPCVGPCHESAEPGKEGEEELSGPAEARAYLDRVHETFPELLRDCFEAHCTYNTLQNTIRHKRIRDKYWSNLSCVKYGGACPVNGEWSHWSEWSPCSLECGAGTRTRTRRCNKPAPAYYGHECRGDGYQEESCVSRDCGSSTSETFTEWTEWSPCSECCGAYGVQTSSRVCLRSSGCEMQGVFTPYINRTKPCYHGECPGPGGWSEWSEWTNCSALCGEGRRSRARLCDSPYATGGLSCDGEPLEFAACKPRCIVPQSSLEEIQAASRKAPEGGETVWLGENDEYDEPLNKALESLYTQWSPWSSCTSSCGAGGTRIRTRSCSPLTTPLPPCEGEMWQVQFCNNFPCPVPGEWGDWAPWTPCSKTCETGVQYQFRACNNPLPQYGGSCYGDAVRTRTCSMPPCPQTLDGAWGSWTSWMECSETCGTGHRIRERQRVRYQQRYPAESLETQNSVMKEKVECNSQPCPVQGSWADWGEWSQCSTMCGMGVKARDRTCTDPAPRFGGKACAGTGSDVVHCFSGPCRDEEDRAIHFTAKSWLRFAPRNRPARFLALYLHFKPLQAEGTVIHRYRQCLSVFDDTDEDTSDAGTKADSQDKSADKDEKCRIVVDLALHEARPVLDVRIRGVSLKIDSNVILLMGSWHEILIEVFKTGASMRINDQPREYASFQRPLVRDIDFDAYMVIGSVDNGTEGFQGSICALSINFKPQDLFATTDLEGELTPVARHAVSAMSINPAVQLPHFRGLYFSILRLSSASQIRARLTLWLDEGEGLILYVPGADPGSHLTVGMRQSRLVTCLRCTGAVRATCHRADAIKLHQWYHLTLKAEKTHAEVRLDQAQASQISCKGTTFTSNGVVYIGGRAMPMWSSVQRMTNYSEGFYGALGTVVLNGRVVSYRHAVLMGRDDRLNPDGYGRAVRITPVFEHKTSVVSLHCDTSDIMAQPDAEVTIIWLLSDTVLEESELVEIIEPIGEKRVGTLVLHPGGHREGLYGCLVSNDGQLILSHVFPVFRHVKSETDVEMFEWILLIVLLSALFILGPICFLIARNRRKQRHGRVHEEGPGSDFEILLTHNRVRQDMDDTTDLQQHLSSDDYTKHNIKVESFKPSKATRVLGITPGVMSRRYIEAGDGTMKLDGEKRRVVVDRYGQRTDTGCSGFFTPNRPKKTWPATPMSSGDIPRKSPHVHYQSIPIGYDEPTSPQQANRARRRIFQDEDQYENLEDSQGSERVYEDMQWHNSTAEGEGQSPEREGIYENLGNNAEESDWEEGDLNTHCWPPPGSRVTQRRGHLVINQSPYSRSKSGSRSGSGSGSRNGGRCGSRNESRSVSRSGSRSGSRSRCGRSPSVEGRGRSERGRSSSVRPDIRRRPSTEAAGRSGRHLRWSDGVVPPRLPPPPPSAPIQRPSSRSRLPSGKYLVPGTPPPPPGTPYE